MAQSEMYRKQLMDRKLENLKVEADLSWQEKDYEESLTKYTQIMKQMILNSSPQSVLGEQLNTILGILKALGSNAEAAARLENILQEVLSVAPGVLTETFYMKGLLELGNFYFLSAQFSAALKSYESLKIVYDKVPGLPFQNFGILYMNKGLCYMYMNNYISAEQNFKRALLCNEDVVGDQAHTQLKALVYQNLGCLYELMNTLDSAQEMYLKALKLNTLIHKGTPNPQYYDLVYCLGAVELRLKNISGSLARLKDLAKLLEAQPPESLTLKLWVRLGLTYYTLGIAYQQSKETVVSRQYLSKALHILQTKGGDQVSEKIISHLQSLTRGRYK